MSIIMEKVIFNLIDKIATASSPDTAVTFLFGSFWFIGGISALTFFTFLYKIARYFWLRRSGNKYPTRGIWISLVTFLISGLIFRSILLILARGSNWN